MRDDVSQNHFAESQKLCSRCRESSDRFNMKRFRIPPSGGASSVAKPAKSCCLAILVLFAAANGSQAETGWAAQIQSGPCLCQVPITKAYRIRPGFCPQQIALMIRQGVPCGSGECCGPYGIPPVYVAGNNVLVRQSPEMHLKTAKLLNEMGAIVPPTAGTAD